MAWRSIKHRDHFTLTCIYIHCSYQRSRGWTTRGNTDGGAKDFLFSISVQTGPEAHPGIFPGGKAAEA